MYIPIFNFIEDIVNNQALHRSFCYGAIDGMLTGAGIVSTFCGMNMLQLSSSASSEIRSLVVVFTAATCTFFEYLVFIQRVFIFRQGFCKKA